LPKKKQKLPTLRLMGFLGLVICLAAFLSGANPAHPNSDVDNCADCHEEVAQAFANNPHAETCSGCHLGADAHLEEASAGNIFAFKSSDPPNEKTKACLSCHAKDNSQYHASPHGKASMDCTSCHAIHTASPKPALLRTNPTKSCLACHGDVFSLFQLNERHRLQEGILECTSCHDPHKPSQMMRLGGVKHEACLKCHQDKGGPFLFEHKASRLEGCRACHEVHGSPNRHMLIQHSISDLCFSCHTAAVSFHERFDSTTTNCTVCHATIHGSNLSHIFIK
jgi:DmsE family decaheme c-type cytochrome